MDSLVKKCGIRFPQPVKEFLAETMGTFILVLFGIGSVAHYVLGVGVIRNDFLSVNFGWGLGAAFGVFWSGGISGGHINPAVTLAMVVAGRLPIKKLPVYWAGQTLGAFVASAIAYAVYYDLLMVKGQNGLTAGIWSTYPAPHVSHATIFGDQLVGTMLLVGTIFALTDKRNMAPNTSVLPLAIGFLILVIGDSFGLNCGYGINPARDLIPRIFTAISGWKSLPFKSHDYFFWIPVVGQLVGGVVGAGLYILTIEMHHENGCGDQHVQTFDDCENAEDKL